MAVSRCILAAVGCLLVCLPSVPAVAQEPSRDLIVTAFSEENAATCRMPEGEMTKMVSYGLPLEHRDRVQVSADARIMVYCSAARAAIVVLGPAEFDVEKTDRATVRLNRGFVVVIADLPAGKESLQVVAPSTRPGAAPLLAAAVGQGRTVLSREGSGIHCAYFSDGAAATTLDVSVGGVQKQVPSNQCLTLDGEQPPQVGSVPLPLRDKLNKTTIAQMIDQQSILMMRKSTAKISFVTRLSEWDAGSRPENVEMVSAAPPSTPDVQQTPTTTVQAQSTQQQGQVSKVTAVENANTMPLLSPAAISVGGGVSAQDINNRAASFATATGSRGLGFFGPSQLAVRGLSNDIRTIGPSGLAGGPR